MVTPSRPCPDHDHNANQHHHYLIVRQDLPLGVLAAQLAHAAGESLSDPRRFGYAGLDAQADYDGCEYTDCSCLHGTYHFGCVALDDCPRCRGAGRHNPTFYVVVLSVPNEAALLEVDARLNATPIPYITIREPDSPYCNAATAIGLLPVQSQDRHTVQNILGKLKLLTELM